MGRGAVGRSVSKRIETGRDWARPVKTVLGVPRLRGCQRRKFRGDWKERRRVVVLWNRRFVREPVVVVHAGVAANTVDGFLRGDLARQEPLHGPANDEGPPILQVQPGQYVKLWGCGTGHGRNYEVQGDVVDVRIRPKQRNLRKGWLSCGAARCWQGRLAGSGFAWVGGWIWREATRRGCRQIGRDYFGVQPRGSEQYDEGREGTTASIQGGGKLWRLRKGARRKDPIAWLNALMNFVGGKPGEGVLG